MLVAALASTADAQWTVVILHPTGASNSQAFSVGGGQQVGGVALAGGIQYASLWNSIAEPWVNLNPGGEHFLLRTAFMVASRWVWSNWVWVRRCASLWTGTATSWVDLSPSGSIDSWRVGCGRQPTGGASQRRRLQHASLWSGSAASWIDLHPVGPNHSYAYNASGGQQVGQAVWDATPTTGGYQHASLWSGTPASWIDLHPAGASGSNAIAVSDGQQVGVAVVGGKNLTPPGAGLLRRWVDLTPVAAGFNWSIAFGADGGHQVGFVSKCDGRASLWGGSAGSWVDLHALLPPGFCELRGVRELARWNPYLRGRHGQAQHGFGGAGDHVGGTERYPAALLPQLRRQHHRPSLECRRLHLLSPEVRKR